MDELAGPDDYWLSLTDAARVTRRQEVTIRRWVASGALPVRSRPLGLNKRTRHVRASDLAGLTPIIDASATISGDAAQIDLLSIPLQQAQIHTAQQQIEYGIRDLATQVAQVSASHEERIVEQSRLLTQVEAAAREVQAAVSTHVTWANEQQAALGSQLDSLQRKLVRYSSRLHQLQDEVQGSVQGLRVDVDDSAKQQEMQQKTLVAHESRITTVEQLVERVQRIEQREAKDARDRNDLRTQLADVFTRASALDERIRSVKSAMESDVSSRDAAQRAIEQQLQDLSLAMADLRAQLEREAAAGRRETDDLGQQIRAMQSEVRERLDQVTETVTALAAAVRDKGRVAEPASGPVRRRRGRARSNDPA